MDEQARKERKNAYMREYRQRNPEKWRRYYREVMRKYRARNPEEDRERKRIYRKKNRLRINTYQRAYYLNRKALKSHEEA